MDEYDLSTRRTMLAAAEAEIASECMKFEESIAPLRERRDQLRRDYAEALHTELTRVQTPAAPTPDLGRILGVIERTHQPVIIERLREAAARYISRHDDLD